MFEGWVTQICQVNPTLVNIDNINFYQWNDDRIEAIAKKDKSRYKLGQDNSGLYVKQENTEWQMMHAHLKPNKDGQQQFLDCFWVIRTQARSNYKLHKCIPYLKESKSQTRKNRERLKQHK